MQKKIRNSLPKKTSENFRIREKHKENPQCYECKGFGHLTVEFANKKKEKHKAIVTTWDDDSNKE